MHNTSLKTRLLLLTVGEGKA